MLCPAPKALALSQIALELHHSVLVQCIFPCLPGQTKQLEAGNGLVLSSSRAKAQKQQGRGLGQ